MTPCERIQKLIPHRSVPATRLELKPHNRPCPMTPARLRAVKWIAGSRLPNLSTLEDQRDGRPSTIPGCKSHEGILLKLSRAASHVTLEVITSTARVELGLPRR